MGMININQGIINNSISNTIVESAINSNINDITISNNTNITIDNITNDILIVDTYEKDNSYIPPSDWLKMPELLSTDIKYCYLFMLTEADNTIKFNYISGVNTISWGDGTTSETGANSEFSHTYNYAEIPESSLTSDGYKQVIITITNIDGFQPTIDLFSSENVVYIKIATNNTGTYNTFSGLKALTIFEWIGENSQGSFSSFFMDCCSLKSVSIFTKNCSSFDNMFAGCTNLTDIKRLDTSNALSLYGTFSGCNSLSKLPDNLQTSKCIDMSYMFFDCLSLKQVPYLDLSSCTSTLSMFNGCKNLTKVPLYDTSNVTDMSYMFFDCYILSEIPDYNTGNCYNFGEIFFNAHSLKKLPSIDISKGVNFGSFFSNSLVKHLPSSYTFPNTLSQSYFGFYNTLIKNIDITIHPSNLSTFTFYVMSNLLTSEGLNNIFSNLDNNTSNKSWIIVINGNPGTYTCDKTIATSKGWTVIV